MGDGRGGQNGVKNSPGSVIFMRIACVLAPEHLMQLCLSDIYCLIHFYNLSDYVIVVIWSLHWGLQSCDSLSWSLHLETYTACGNFLVLTVWDHNYIA